MGAQQNETKPADATKGTPARETTIITADQAAPTTDTSGTSARGEVSALVIARMMGLATVNEFRTVEGKVDLIMSKLNLIQTKVEKAISVLGTVPTGADIERVDVQIGALRQLLRETLVTKVAEADAGTGLESGKKPGSSIQSNEPTPKE